MIEELGDRWLIGLRGIPVLAVDRTQGGPDLTLTLSDGVVLTVSGSVLLTEGPSAAPGAVVLSVEESSRLVGATVLSAVAFKSGLLRMVFSTGHHLSIRGAEPEETVRLQKPGVFRWSCHQGVGTMKIFGSEDFKH
ncbi:DUF6188 family protein [Streptomyces sp. NBC_00091]|uniref:DUF6188 family protein n=1 Tax=Streptomyces sp. NBC_00091 TaxID=2975648 RepID=UPI00224D1E44|nr:DUF6188 family protein [Streptomyces sp. NBC_00091]MCX5376208.1 DUF6188 family protein [Streptomyces sp. NBC_00091]